MTSRRWVIALAGAGVLAAGVTYALQPASPAARAARAATPLRTLGPTPSLPPLPTRAPGQPVHGVLGLGDSVPAAAACGCTSFVLQLATALSALEHTRVVVGNEGLGGQTSAGLLNQVRSRGTRARAGQVTVITIGANDFDESTLTTPACSTAAHLACYQPELRALRANMNVLLDVLRSGGSSGRVLVTGYWNVFLDGAVADAQGAAYVRNSDALTRAVNAVLKDVTTRHHMQYVDLYGAFKQPDGDDTTLLAADGDHPSALGHALIARLLTAAVAATLT